jgi:Fis family transcriptional regulator
MIVEHQDSLGAHQGREAPADPSPVLSEQVRLAVRDYLSRLDGCAVNNLYAMVLEEVERPLLLTVLEHCGYNQSRAAQMLGVSRSTLRKKMLQHGLE